MVRVLLSLKMPVWNGSEPADFAFTMFLEFEKPLDKLGKRQGRMGIKWSFGGGVDHTLETYTYSKTAETLGV